MARILSLTDGAVTITIVSDFNGANGTNGDGGADPAPQEHPVEDGTPILDSLLETADVCAKSARHACEAVDAVSIRLDIAERDIDGIKDTISDLRGVRVELRSVSSQIGMLNDNVMRNLRGDVDRERRLGELQAVIASEASRKGAIAGAKLSAIVSGAVSLLWLLAWLWATYSGAAPRFPKPF